MAAVPAYNSNYLKTASTKTYPLPVLSELDIKAGMMDQPVETPDKFTPESVLELIKLLNTGDISDEAREEYEADAAKMSAFAVIAKQRPLSASEQEIVDVIGRRLADEARELVAEDVAAERDTATGLAALSNEHKRQVNHLSEVEAASVTASAELATAVTAAATAEAAIEEFAKLSRRAERRIGRARAYFEERTAANDRKSILPRSRMTSRSS